MLCNCEARDVNLTLFVVLGVTVVAVGFGIVILFHNRQIHHNLNKGSRRYVAQGIIPMRLIPVQCE